MNSSRNIYRREIDFRALALQSPEFSKRLKANDQLDFSDPDAVRQLTKSLLERDFKIRVDLPDNRLCPPVPNRLNYILWLQDLLDTTSEAGDDEYDPEREVLGLDIGTGCCSIYPLLGCSMRSRWKFFATDIDEENILSSRKTVSENQKCDRITIVKTDPSDLLLPLDKLGIDRVWKTGLPVRSAVLKPHAGWLVVGWVTTSESQLLLDFTMCNPPFYESEQELLSSAAAKSRPPYSACTGAAVEMITPGGEITFVSNMITQSMNLKTRVRWFTSMLGKLSSLSAIVQKLLDLDVENWAVTEFVQGKGTKRWAVGWSWMDWRPRSDVSRGLSTLPKHLLPFPSHFYVELPKDSKLEQVCSKLESELSALRYLVHTWVAKESCVGFVKEDVWSRKARRKFLKEQHTKSNDENDDSHVMKSEEQWEKAPKDIAALGFRVDLRLEADNRLSMVIRWLKGMDQVLFESFCGMIKRKSGEE